VTLSTTRTAIHAQSDCRMESSEENAIMGSSEEN